jgi:hypothetical protein
VNSSRRRIIREPSPRASLNALVDGENPRFPILNISRCRDVFADALMHLARDVIQLNQIAITNRPAIDRGFQIAEMTKIEIQPNQAGDVIGMVAALQNSVPRRLQIRWLSIKGQTQLMPALWHGNRLLVLEKDCLVAAVSVEIQIIDRVFLALGPETLTGDIATHGRQDVKTHAPQ